MTEWDNLDEVKADAGHEVDLHRALLIFAIALLLTALAGHYLGALPLHPVSVP